MFQKFKRRFSNVQHQQNSSLDSSEGSSSLELTAKEIQLVRSTWVILRNDLASFKFLGAELFVRYFTKYPDYQQKFKSFKDIPINFQQNSEIRIDKKLLAHGTYVMYTIGMLVDNLENPIIMDQMLKRLARNHYRRRVSLLAFEQLRDILMELLLDCLGPEIFNKNTMAAWCKAFEYLLTEIGQNFKLFESDIHHYSSYYRLNSLHRNAKQHLVRDYGRMYLFDYQVCLRRKNEQHLSKFRLSKRILDENGNDFCSAAAPNIGQQQFQPIISLKQTPTTTIHIQNSNPNKSSNKSKNFLMKTFLTLIKKI